MKQTLTALALILGTTQAQAFDINAMTDAERAAFNDSVRAYLLENPEIIFEAVEIARARDAENQAANDQQLLQANSEDLFNDPNSWVGGNPDGDVTLVEFIDYRCGYCRKAHDEVAELIKSDGNIRFIVKEFPILGDASTLSSQFAIATRLVAGDDAYKAVGDALIKMRGEPSDAALRRIANTLGLDTDAIMGKMSSDDITAIIESNHSLGQRLQINGTPSFVMGDEMLRGYLPLDTMREVVKEIRKKG